VVVTHELALGSIACVNEGAKALNVRRTPSSILSMREDSSNTRISNCGPHDIDGPR
jgi:hypothetical protein